jgi:hypothetical protein
VALSPWKWQLWLWRPFSFWGYQSGFREWGVLVISRHRNPWKKHEGCHTVMQKTKSLCTTLGQKRTRKVDSGGRHPLSCHGENLSSLRGLQVVGSPSPWQPKLRLPPWMTCWLNDPLLLMSLSTSVSISSLKWHRYEVFWNKIEVMVTQQCECPDYTELYTLKWWDLCIFYMAKNNKWHHWIEWPLEPLLAVTFGAWERKHIAQEGTHHQAYSGKWQFVWPLSIWERRVTNMMVWA